MGETSRLLRLLYSQQNLIDSLLESRMTDAYLPPEGVDLKGLMDAYQKRVIEHYLRIHEGNVRKTAKALGVVRTTLHVQITRLNIKQSYVEEGEEHTPDSAIPPTKPCGFFANPQP